MRTHPNRCPLQMPIYCLQVLNIVEIFNRTAHNTVRSKRNGGTLSILISPKFVFVIQFTIIGIYSGNGLKQIRWRAIIWPNDGLIHSRIYPSLRWINIWRNDMIQYLTECADTYISHGESCCINQLYVVCLSTCRENWLNVCRLEWCFILTRRGVLFCTFLDVTRVASKWVSSWIPFY